MTAWRYVTFLLLCFLCVVGTNNARLATMLRQLAIYHAKDPNNLFCVRIAQGLTHLSKGTLTLCPYQADRQIMNPIAVAGLLTFLVSCLDVKTSEFHIICSNICLFCPWTRDRIDPCSGSESEADSPKSVRSRSNGNRKPI